jgi:hypothetical protein
MNSLVRTAVISAEPVSLADMKNWLRVPVSVTNDDFRISRLITAARIQCELISNSALVRSSFVQYLDHFPGSQENERNQDFYGGASSSGSNGMGYDRHHRWHGEIKIKRPPLVQVQSIVFIGTDGRPYTLNPGQDFVVDIASVFGRVRPIPYTVWPLTLHVPAAVAIKYTAGYAPNASGLYTPAGQTAIAEPETDTSALNPTWKPTTAFSQYAFQADATGNLWIQTTAVSGLTGSARPGFEAAAIGAAITGDGTANWLNVGPIRGFWTPGTNFAGLQTYVILDFNSNLQLLNVAALISQPIAPYSLQVVGVEPLPWSSTLGGFTADNGVAQAWRCLGAYTAEGDNGLAVPNSPEQQAAVLIDLTLPETATMAIMTLVSHWYYNREIAVGGQVNKVPLLFEDMLGDVTAITYSPTR